MGAAFAGLFGLFFLMIFAVPIVGLVFWIVKLIEVIQIPDHQFRAAATEKVPWVLVVVLGSYIGALVWHFGKRERVRAAAGQLPLPPPGWYPDVTPGTMNFWDGSRWTSSWHNPPPG